MSERATVKASANEPPRAPPLFLLSAILAVSWWAITRVLLKLETPQYPLFAPETAFFIAEIGWFLRDAAAISATICFAAALYGMNRPATFWGFITGLSLAGIAGVLVPIVVMSIFLPFYRSTTSVALIGGGAANLTIVILAASLLSKRARTRALVPPGRLPPKAERGARLFVGFAALSAFFGFMAIGVQLIGRVTGWEGSYLLGQLGLWTGEIAHALSIASLAFVAALGLKEPRRALAAGIALVAFVLLDLGVHALVGPQSFATVLYGASHFSVLSVRWPYEILIGLLWIAGWSLIAAGARKRILGASALLWLAAGFAPTTALNALLSVCAVAITVWCLVEEPLQGAPSKEPIEEE